LSSEAKPNEAAEKGIELSVRFRGEIYPRKRRSEAALRKIRSAASSMVDVEKIVISPALSEMIWRRGIEKPPRILRLIIEVDKDEGVATVLPAGVARND
jgi:ribosomal protein L31E